MQMPLFCSMSPHRLLFLRNLSGDGYKSTVGFFTGNVALRQTHLFMANDHMGHLHKSEQDKQINAFIECSYIISA